eukprot:COSAG06_NODE_345_length_17054_cov_3.313476_2_plen_1074_part_00
MNVEVAAKDEYGNAITAPGLTFKMHIDQDMDAEAVPTQAWDAEYLSRFEPGTAAAPIEKFRLVAPQVPSRGVFNVRIVYVDGAVETEIAAVVMTAQSVACDDMGPAQANELGTSCVCLAGHGLSAGLCVLCSATIDSSDTSNLHSTAGICTVCPAGKQPIADETDCIECYDGFASLNGLCMMCSPGKRPTEGRSRCDFCEAGKEPTPVDESNLVFTANGTTCAPCPPNGTREANDGSGCVACPGPGYQVPNDEHSRCVNCPSGSEAAANNSACVPCEMGKARFMTDTQGCTLCPPSAAAPEDEEQVYDQVPNADQSGCELCGDGEEPDDSGATCVACPTGKARAADQAGLCQQCDTTAGLVPDENKRECELCPAGQAPAADGSSCIDCEVGKARAAAATEGCSLCPASADAPADENGVQVRDQVPNADQSGCELCGDGEEPDESRATCVACPTGTARAADQAGLCQQCEVDDGLIPDENKRECELCPAGQAPAADGSSCIDCEVGKARAAVATEGCSLCPASAEAPTGENGVQVRDQVPNTDQSGCALCGDGEEPDGSRATCVACAARSVRAADDAGLCQQCEVDGGLIPDENKRECELCPTGREPAANGTACVQCPPGRARDRDHPGRCVQCVDGKAPYPETGDNSAGECRTCDSGKVRQSSRLQDVCVACPTGTQPDNPDLPIECAECPGSTVNDEQGGLCEQCPNGKQPNLPQKTACETCPPKHAIEPGSSECILCGTGKYANGQQTLCVQCPNGQQVNATESGCEPCPVGTIGDLAALGTCIVCPTGQVPNVEQIACIECPIGETTSPLGTHCICDVGFYSVTQLPRIHCFDHDFRAVVDPPTPSANRQCVLCEECLSCSEKIDASNKPVAPWRRAIALRYGYQFVAEPGRTHDTMHAFKCPVESACPHRTLQTISANITNPYRDAHTQANSSTLHPRLAMHACTNGTTGHVCGVCAAGYKQGPTGICNPCTAINGGFLSPMLLIPVAVAGAYMALRNLLTFKRNKRAQKLVAAKGLFADMDADGSDEITREELEFGLSILQGKDANKDTVAKLVEEVDLGELLTAVWL